MTSARLRPQAEGGLIERTRYYRSEGGDDLGRRFFDAAISALELSVACLVQARHVSVNSATFRDCALDA